MEESHPDETHYHELVPQNLFYLVGGTAVLIISIIYGILFLTPLGGIIVGKEDQRLHKMAYELSQNLESLRDSLEARDRQLESIKGVLVGDRDTNFVINAELISRNNEYVQAPNEVQGNEPITIENPKEDYSTPTFFPVPPPAEGNFTRGFTPEIGHFGLDIASEKGSSIRSLADGIVIYADWTMNYGNVIYIQHGNGYISAYKHCESLFKKVGEVVANNDIIATVGDGGVISSGPHLHLELWRNGLPLNPRDYITE